MKCEEQGSGSLRNMGKNFLQWGIQELLLSVGPWAPFIKERCRGPLSDSGN
jgi:hypothetical protein